MNPTPSPRTAVVLVAAGRATRMGVGLRKPFLSLGHSTVIETAAQPFAQIANVAELVIVAHADDLARMRELARQSPHLSKVRAIVAGGEERTDSVRAGVDAVSGDADLIGVHDAARPLVQRETIERAIAAAWTDDAALVAIPARDTIKVSSTGTHAEHTLERSVLWAAQTPQVFKAGVLRELVARAVREGFKATDDAALYEQYVGPVALVLGDPQNFKITTPGDLAMAQALLELRAKGGST